MSKADKAMGDIDEMASKQQVPGVYKYRSEYSMAHEDIDTGPHGGVNDIVEAKDGAAGSTTMTMHSSSAPTPADMGIS